MEDVKAGETSNGWNRQISEQTTQSGKTADSSISGSLSSGDSKVHPAVLTQEETKNLRDTMRRKNSRVGLTNEEEGHGHGHGQRPKSILTAFVSALINFLLMFGLCCAYGMIMFEDDWNTRHRGLAVKMNLATAMLAGLVLAFFSRVPVAIGGPDLNPVVFLGMFVTTIAEDLANQLGLDLPESAHRRLGESGASSSSSDFCNGADYISSDGGILANACDSYHDQLRATTIFTVALSSAMLGCLFFVLGRFKLTRFVSFIPTNIMEAFLSCIGYKVFKYALKFCKYKAKQFIPAACIGVPLYFVKALHLGNPAIVIPVMLLVPLGLFYIGVYASGDSLDSMREKGWMFDKIQNSPVETVWTDSVLYGNAANINFQAWSKTLTDLPIMIIICLLDCLLKLSSTDSKLPVKAEKDYEIQLYGATNLLTTLCGSSVGYMQLKFNVINYGVLGNITDRRAGAIYAVFCGICFFWSTDLFNYLPRFFLSTLLFFAGAGFVAENLWGSRQYLSLVEWLQILIILAIFILSGSLLYAVIVGGLLAGATFIFRYAKVPCLAAPPMRGGRCPSCERHSAILSYGLRNISDSWVMVVRLKGYVFFASAQKVIDWVSEYVERTTKDLPPYRQLRWVIFDCSKLDGMDPSASKAVSKLVKQAMSKKVRVLWSGASGDFVRLQKQVGTITSNCEVFVTEDQAMCYVEEEIIKFIQEQQRLWVSVSPYFRAFHQQHRLRTAADPFADILQSDVVRFSCPWQFCTRTPITAYSTVLWKHGDVCEDLFLVHSGAVGLFSQMPEAEDEDGWAAPAAVYGHGWFLNHEALNKERARFYAVALEDGELLRWDRESWEEMVSTKPRMASAIMSAMLLQNGQERSNAKQADSQDVSFAAIEEQEVGAEKASDEYANLPGGLQEQLQGLAVAQKLEDMGFFCMPCTGEAAPLPVLPKCLQQELEVAFRTFRPRQPGQAPSNNGPFQKDTAAEVTDVDAWSNAQAEGCSNLPQTFPLREALAYIGFHGIVLAEDQVEKMGLDDFLQVGHQAAFMPFSQSHEAKTRELFKSWDKGEGLIGRQDLVALLQSEFHAGISASEVGGIVDLWWTESSTGINEDMFVAIMSRFVRKQEPSWLLLQGLRELLGKKTLEDGDRVSPECLTSLGAGLETERPPISREQAEAMLWFVDRSVVSTEDHSADCRLIAAALLYHMAAFFPLPPAPVLRSGLQPAWTDFFPRASSKTPMRTCLIDTRSLAFKEATKADVAKLFSQLDAPSHAISTSHFQRNSATEVDKKEEIVAVDSTTDFVTVVPESGANPRTCRAKLHLFLEEPNSSPWANAMSIVMGMLILASVFTLFLEPLVRSEDPTEAEDNCWYGFEAFFTMVFTIELLLRFAVADALGTQTHCGFWKMPMNICDSVAILPFYIDQMFSSDNAEFRLLRVIRLARLARVVRLARLAKRSATFAPIAVILVVIWGIYMKNGLTE
jgi:SulP family sulfate permease